MTQNSSISRLAVCSWSLQPPTPQDLIAKLKDTAIDRLQLALDPLRDAPAVWGQTSALFQQHGIGIISGMFGCVGEDYSSLDTIRVTGGIAPDNTWEQNLRNIRATAVLARQLGLKLVTFHAGFVPHDESDPNFSKCFIGSEPRPTFFRQRESSWGWRPGKKPPPGCCISSRQSDGRTWVLISTPPT
jgi:hypothetical protein